MTFNELKRNITTDVCSTSPTMSNRGMKYILVLYNYDSNLIAARTMQLYKGAAVTDTYESIYIDLTDTGITPILEYLDNETSKELIAAIKKNYLKYQLAAPHDHQLNSAERAVNTFNNQFLTILAGCDKLLPKYQWCQLVPQAVVILNVLQQSRISFKLSTHNQVFGKFNFQQTRLAPLGTKVITHERPDQRKTWHKNSLSGFMVN